MFDLTRRLSFATLATLALIGPATAHAAKPATHKPVTVMTRNLYLGGDITRPLTATEGKSALDALVAFGRANHALRAVVDKTDFRQRAKLLAKEIATRKPDLVGMQEVATWRHGPMELSKLGVSNATIVDYDFLALLQSALKKLHARYSVVSNQTESDVEGPAFADQPNDATSRDERLTMHDVILKRTDSSIKVLKSGSAQYAARLTVSIQGVQFNFIRGYNWADVRAGSHTFRFVNTHLESQSSSLALAQAKELLKGPAKVSGRSVVVVCDCNSDPLDHSTKSTDNPPTPHSAPYDQITGAGGFTDEWLRFAPARKGFTSGLSETVDDKNLKSIDHRIDMVFGHTAAGKALRVDKGWIVGNDPKNRSASGLWPSDHMGVVMRLRP